jgi:hypothetical protein
VSQTLQEKQDEKGRLLKAYRLWKRQQWTLLTEQEPRLLLFRRWLGRQTDPCEALIIISNSWLRFAPDSVKHIALGLIEKHAGKQAEYQGREPLDDPWPGKTSFYFTAREMFAVR